MKIENDKPNPLTAQADALAPTPAASSPVAGKTSAAQKKGDQLTLSPEAQLLQAAAGAATDDPAVRQELVDKMRALLNDGKIGIDADQLAESLIDDVIKNR